MTTLYSSLSVDWVISSLSALAARHSPQLTALLQTLT